MLDVETGVRPPALYASKDIDFEGRTESVQQAGLLLDGRVFLPRQGDMTPSTGLVLFRDSDGIEREVDFLTAPLGLDAEDVRSTAIRVEVPDPDGPGKPASLWVLHPERCMESRVKNWMVLKHRGEIARSQLLRSIECGREFSRYVLEGDQLDAKARVRAVLDLNERIFQKSLSDRDFRSIYREFQIDPFDAVLDHEALPDKFRAIRLPQMRDELAAKRDRP